MEGGMQKPHGRDEVVQAIIQAAIPLIAERGVKAVTLRDVAKAANVAHGLIARHFGTKEGLVQQVSEQLVRLFLDAAKRSNPQFMVPLWQTIQENGVAASAFARIIQETAPDPASQLTNNGILDEVVQWLRTNVSTNTETNAFPEILAIYMLAVLFFGGQTFGRHLQIALRLSDNEFLSLRAKSFELVLRGLSSVSKD
jgi:AcrR family transcriptional regulator